MTIATIVTRGYGSFGSIADVVLRGYAIGEEVGSERSPYPPPIDMRSGFKTRPEDLVKEYTGLMVRASNLDQRHPQEFVRPRRDHQGVPDARPEPEDTFLDPNEITRDSY